MVENRAAALLFLQSRLLAAVHPLLVPHLMAVSCTGDTAQFCPLPFIAQNSWQYSLWRASSLALQKGNTGQNLLPFITSFFIPHATLCTDRYVARFYAVGGGMSKGMKKKVGKIVRGTEPLANQSQAGGPLEFQALLSPPMLSIVFLWKEPSFTSASCILGKCFS